VRKVLMINYAFPEPGEMRMSGYLKYLPQFGWEPYVLSGNVWQKGKEKDVTPALSDISDLRVFYIRNLFDPGRRAKGIPEDSSKPAKIGYRIVTFFRWFVMFVVMRLCTGWIPTALLFAKKIIEKENIDLIWAFPAPGAVMGVLLKKITKRPLIIDYPDPWTFNPHYSYPSRFYQKLDMMLEKWVLKNCDQLIVATKWIKNKYLLIYPWLDKKIWVLRNGFYSEHFLKNQILEQSNNKFTITYTGRFYGLRSPKLFLEALNRIFIERKIPRDDIRVFFIGSKAGSTKVDNLIKDLLLQDLIIQTNWVSVEKSYDHILKSDLLLIPEFANVLTTKAFEYLATGKPILAIIPEGELAELIREYSDNSYIITSGSVDEIADAILDAYGKWKEGKLTLSSKEKVERFRKKYNRKNLTKELADVFNMVLKNPNRRMKGV